jgi:hypothetical protein
MVAERHPTSDHRQMGKWIWANPRWRDQTGDDPHALLSEALRRAVDIRDAGEALSARGTLLVDVLNQLATALNYELGDLWKGYDTYLR